MHGKLSFFIVAGLVVGACAATVGPFRSTAHPKRGQQVRKLRAEDSAGSTTRDAPHTVPRGVLVELAVGATHVCSRSSTGLVDCWGSGRYGELGNGRREESGVPVAVEGVRGCTQITSGSHHVCALVSSGRVLCWGSNLFGQLGRGTLSDAETTPRFVVDLFDAVEVRAGLSGSRTCARKRTGAVVCWGDLRGDDPEDATRRSLARPVEVPDLPPVVGLAVGAHHSCARTYDGSVYCWGANFAAQLGQEPTEEAVASSITPLRVARLTEAVSLVGGANHTCARLGTGGVTCWGANDRGQCGVPESKQPVLREPIVGVTEVASITAGAYHTCAVEQSGQVYCWGGGEHGELGDRACRSRSTPRPLEGENVYAFIAGGATSTCGIDHASVARCWGRL